MSDFKINSFEHSKIKNRDINLSDPVSRISSASILERISRTFRKLWKSNSKDEDSDELLIDCALDDTLPKREKEIVKNVLRFRQIRIDDIMIPRVNINAVEDKATIYEILTMLDKHGRSWMPVYRGNLDSPRGMVHMRDLLAYITRSYTDFKNSNLNTTLAEANVIKDILFVPSSMLASDLLWRMQESQVHMALVIDEHGGTDGLVAHEDIVAIFMGYVKSDHNNKKEMISVISDNTFIVDARADLEELAKVMGLDCDIFKGGQDVDSLGGLIFSVLDRIPVRGEIILEIPEFEITILDSDVRCVRRVRIRHLASFKD